MAAAHEAREVSSEEEATAGGDELRRGPWTVEEDLLLVNYIAAHGEGRWNALARCAGLKRTGKSCRLRWLNYLRPDVRRGNMTAQEQLVILELHARWGNRWSKIAQHLPGRTDNEIKNYWRTRVQKHAKHLNCDVNSQQFKDLMRYLWMPRLVERIRSHSDDADDPSDDLSAAQPPPPPPSHQLVPSPPPLAVPDTDSSSSNDVVFDAAAAMCQQLELPPQHHHAPTMSTMSGGGCLDPAATTHELFDHHQFVSAAAETTTTTTRCSSWSESLPGLAGVVYDDMALLPDFDMGGVETMTTMMWGSSCADDDSAWYTHMNMI